MTDERGPIRLSSFRVDGLFGEFNHHIPLSDVSRITALIGPNGMGKTACLRLINALFRRQWSVFSTTEFDQIEYLFSDTTLVRVRHGESEATGDEPGITTGVVVETWRQGELIDTWCPRLSEARGPLFGRIDSHVPILTRTGPRTWTHDITRQTFSLQEVIETFGDRLPE